jgi:O-antigen ligase
VTQEVGRVLALPTLVVAIFLGGYFAFASFRAPLRTLLPVFAFIVPVGSIVTVPLPLPSPFNSLSSLVGGMLLGALLVHLVGERAAGRRFGRRLPAQAVLWLLFVGLSALTLLWSINPSETVSGLTILFSLVAIYILALLADVTLEELRRIELAIVLGGVVAAGYALVLLLSSGLHLFGGHTPRFASTGGAGEDAGPNETAAALLLPLAIAVGRVVDRSFRARRGWWILGSISIAIAITLTASRGGLVSMGLLLVALAWNEGRIRVAIFVGMCALIALIVVPQFGAAALQERLFKQSSSGRTGIWRTALEACNQHCLVGSGYETFGDAYNEAVGVSPDIMGPQLRKKAHNIWVRAMIETGLLGVLLLTAALIAQLRDLGKLPRRFRGPPLAGFLGVVAANVFLSNLGFKYFWLAMTYAGLAAVVYGAELDTAPMEVPRERAAVYA